MDTSMQERYCRQTTIQGFGVSGQERLMQGSVVVVGAGGLGSPVLLYLAGVGVGRIGICDDDCVSVSNLPRQVIHCESNVGKNKAVSAKERMMSLNSHSTYDVYPARITAENVFSIIVKYDVVVDATDNFAARYLLNDACIVLKKPLVSAAVLRFEGQITVYSYKGGPCYRCLNPSPPPPSSIVPCASAGVMGPVPGVVGCLEAVEVVKILTQVGEPLSGRMLLYDGLNATSRVLRTRPKQDTCPCSQNPQEEFVSGNASFYASLL
ncbi:molybdopterin-synthase adenylyltransferase MoeB [Pelomyxa schiedti]|nr:molybdopterin-synthase adenylyltransferase MoeB [Pelomyxa schiedti]